MRSNRSNQEYFQGEAIVIAVENPKQRPYWIGRVAFAGSYWNARTLAPANLQVGDICEAIGNSNITVIIRPLAPVKSAVTASIPG
jgi:membrane protein implicated in regulation of membrane protease activity